MEMEQVVWRLKGGSDVVDNERGNGVRQTKPHPQPLPEEGGEQLAMEMEQVVWRLKGCVGVIDNKA